MRLPALVSVSIGLAAAPSARAQLPHHESIGGTEWGIYGSALAGLGDLNGDGCDEFAVGEPGYDKFRTTGAGRALVFDGATGALLRSHVGTYENDFHGTSITTVGDWSGDGVPDYAVLLSGRDTAGSNAAGRIEVYSGADGSLVQAIDGEKIFAFGLGSLSPAADFDGDGFDDLLVGMPMLTEARIYGRTGALLHAILSPNTGEGFGSAVARIADDDGDGVDELAISEPDYSHLSPFRFECGRVVIHSGATGAELRTLIGDASNDKFGTALARLGDLDGDGLDEFAVGAPNAGGLAGRLTVYRGGDLGVLHAIDGAAYDFLGAAVCGTGDLDHDGVPDLAVTAAGLFGEVEVRSGADASVLWLVDDSHVSWPTSDLGGALAGGDWNGDGIGDLLVADPYALDVASGQKLGAVAAFLGCPAWSVNYGSGLAGSHGVPALYSLDVPAFGYGLDVVVVNSSRTATPALLVAGTQAISVPWKGGTMLASSDLLALFFTLPWDFAVVSDEIPGDPAFAFFDLYLQAFQLDPGASKGVAISPGLHLHVGYETG